MQSSEEDAASKVLTILFADDDPLARELIGAKLRAHRYRVIEVESGDQALPLLQGGGIDVLLTDVSMPGAIDGWSLAEQARRIQPQIAVIYSSSGLVDAARQVSRSVYLRKPYHLDAIVAAVRKLTSGGDDCG